MNAYVAWTEGDWVAHYTGQRHQAPTTWVLDGGGRRMARARSHEIVRRPGEPRFNTGAIITPGDVLAYRKTWDGYVMGMARLLDACADAWDAASKSDVKDPNLSYAWLEDPSNTKAMAAKATFLRACVNTIVTRWNLFAAYTDMQVVLMGDTMLKSFQETVLKVGQEYVPYLTEGCPKAKMPPVPSPSVQAQVIGRIEGLGILAVGVLEMLGVAANGVLQLITKAGKYVDQHLPKDPLGTIEGIAIAVAVGFGIYAVAPLLRGVGGAAGNVAEGATAHA